MADTKSTGLDPTPCRAVTAVRAVITGFDRIGLAGRQDNGGEYPARLDVVIAGDDDPTRNENFLGDAPFPRCSDCGERYDRHWDHESGQFLNGREWHRLDRNPNGFYSDELPAVTR